MYTVWLPKTLEYFCLMERGLLFFALFDLLLVLGGRNKVVSVFPDSSSLPSRSLNLLFEQLAFILSSK